MKKKYKNRRICVVKEKDKDAINAALYAANNDFGPNTFSVPQYNNADKITHYVCDIALTGELLTIMDNILQKTNKGVIEDVGKLGVKDRLKTVVDKNSWKKKQISEIK